jgi:phospholipase C
MAQSVTIQQPVANTQLAVGASANVAGIVTGKGMPEPTIVQSVTVQIGGGPSVPATITVIPSHLPHPPGWEPSWTFRATVTVPNLPGPTSVIVRATYDSGQTITASESVIAVTSAAAATLQKVTITFNTHGDNKDGDTLLHVFVKNRSNTSATPQPGTDFVGNLLSYQDHEASGTSEINPFLAFGESLAQGTSFDDPSSHTFDLPLRSTPIPVGEVILPVVNIHIQPNGNDRWIFDYTITFLFSDGRSFSATSNTDGITGIILDQDNRNFSGICVENPFITLPPLVKPETDAVLTQVTLAFSTHNDNKNNDTVLNVHLVNRLSATPSQDIAIGLDLLKGQEFPDPSTKTVVFAQSALPLASNAIQLRDMVLPVVFINIVPGGNDRWIFDYQVTYTFSNGQEFLSQTNGVILDQNNHKHAGVYEGPPFPTVALPSKPPQTPQNGGTKMRNISLSYVQKKLDELINKRTDPPIWNLFLHNTGSFGDQQPESYYDVQFIIANPPPPGTLSPPGFVEGVTYDHSPTSLGRLGDGLYFHNINTAKITANIAPSQPTPLTVEVDFNVSAPGSGIGGWTTSTFYLRIGLTLGFDSANSTVDVLSWVPTITDDDQIGNYLTVRVVTGSAFNLGGAFQKRARQTIFDKLTTKDPFTGKTLRERLNAEMTSWLVGGFTDGPSACKVQSVQPMGDNLQITYTGPDNLFEPAAPAGWPTGTDFSPGNLANIDHIVVLTMENRSFDHMLGYLSLPPEKGGMGRKDVDGLKGTEFNLFNGQVCPSFPLAAEDTIFAPDPPHGTEPVARAINGGKMDGFVQSYADERGPTVAPRIMGYHTAVNVPVYDLLARDFAIGHRWFASHPGPTFCNRFYELTGRLNVDPNGFFELDNSSPLRPVSTPTIFDKLSDQKVSWTYFEHHYCFLRFFGNFTFDTTNVAAYDDPVVGFVNLAKNGALPSVSFIDPHFIELPPGGNCDGPPADVKAGQALVQEVVQAVITSPKWSKTLLLITYDEHGGFYDHVPPPPAARVTPDSLGTYGVRVPAFVISPWVKGGTVFGHDGIVVGDGGSGTVGSSAAAVTGPGLLHSQYFDHTSILKTIARRFLSNNPPYLGARYAAANDLSAVIGSEPRPSQFLPFIPYNLVYGASQKRLDVQGASVAPGTPLWQYDPNDTGAQQFSFEDAGGGFFYLRTHTGSLYVTADDSLHLKQDVKYPTDGSATAANNPDRQRWQFTSNSITVLDQSSFAITNAAFPGKVLQPLGGSNTSGTAIVLGDPQAPHLGVTQTPNPWQITSPLLPSGGVVAHA